jgi:uncharacterized protein (TIGR02246 family)
MNATSTSTATVGATPVAVSAGEPEGIELTAAALLARLETAWNDGDGDAFGAVFDLDADFVDIRGDHHVGRPAIAAGHQAILESIYAGSTVRYVLESARLVGPATAVAVAVATLDAPVGPLQGTNRSRITLVLSGSPDGWAVSAFQNTLRPPTP